MLFHNHYLLFLHSTPHRRRATRGADEVIANNAYYFILFCFLQDQRKFDKKIMQNDGNFKMFRLSFVVYILCQVLTYRICSNYVSPFVCGLCVFVCVVVCVWVFVCVCVCVCFL